MFLRNCHSIWILCSFINWSEEGSLCARWETSK